MHTPANAAADLLLEKEAFLRAGLFGKKLRPGQLSEVQKYVTDTGWAQDSQQRNALLGMLIGDKNPLKVLKARWNQGGLLGKGGIIRGDLAFDPTMKDSWRKFRDTDASFGQRAMGLGGTALKGGMGSLNMVGGGIAPLGYAGLAAYQGDWGGAAGGAFEPLGYAVGAPFGIVGALGAGAASGSLGKMLGEKATLPAPALPVAPRAAQQAGAVGLRPSAVDYALLPGEQMYASRY
jgi:hypothetical protein